ncbi:MAG: GerMN domain-containing protein [Acidobacteriota bacterium]
MRWLRPLVAAILLLVGLAAAAVLVSRSRGRSTAPVEVPGTPEPTPVPASMTLFFPGPDLALHRERRLVAERPPTTQRCAAVVLEELLAGSQEGWASPFTWPASVDAVFVTSAGNVVADISPPPAGQVQGTASEVGLIYSAVNSLVASCPGVARVQLLFGGRQVESFGHLDLSRPLAPRPDLVAP